MSAGRNTTAVAPYLHVANGTSTTMTIAAAAIPGLRSIWADPLHDGPVPAGLSDDELREVRSGHLDDGSHVDPENDMRRWRQIIDDHDAYGELVLWFEHDLFDQLNLIQLLTRLRASLPRTKPVSLVCIGSFPGRPDFKGLGELSTSELAPLLEARQPVTDQQYALAEQAWHAFREPSPESLDELRRVDTSALPFLARALERFLQDYPSTVDGLSRTERRLLQLAAGGPIAMHAVFPGMHEGERAYYVSDLSLKDLVETLTATTPPLLSCDTDASHYWRSLLRLSDAGGEALSGQRDRVACGLDRWMGGVHLKTGGAMWRWDEAHSRIVLG